MVRVTGRVSACYASPGKQPEGWKEDNTQSHCHSITDLARPGKLKDMASLSCGSLKRKSALDAVG